MVRLVKVGAAAVVLRGWQSVVRNEVACGREEFDEVRDEYFYSSDVESTLG